MSLFWSFFASLVNKARHCRKLRGSPDLIEVSDTSLTDFSGTIISS